MSYASTKRRTERIKCNAYYAGGGAKLGVAIRCASDSYRIEIRSKLSYSGGRLSGNWEERTFNASGSASGPRPPTSFDLDQGRCSGTMLVNFTKSSQSVTISTQGAALQGVRAALARSLTSPDLSRHEIWPCLGKARGLYGLSHSDHNAGGFHGERCVFADGERRTVG